MDTCPSSPGFQTVQGALNILTMLNLTEFLWPPEADDIKDGASFDFIIIGAGTAGCVVANRLTEVESVSVLLIEAGGDPPIESLIPSLQNYLKKSPFDWNTKSECDYFLSKCHTSAKQDLIRGKMLGGTSSLNYMVYTRGSREDYRNWAKITKDSSWAYDNVLPYFKKSEKLTDQRILNSPDGVYHGTSGNMKIKKYYHPETKNYFEAYEEFGCKAVPDVNGRTSVGVTEPLYTIAHGVRQSTAYAFLKPIKNRPNLYVLRNTTARKIIVNSNKRAIGVKIQTKYGKSVTLKSMKEVIVCAGAINTPQLLMLSGIGPKEDLESNNIKPIVDLPVGYNYINHLSVTLNIKFNQTRKKSQPKSPHEIPEINIIGYLALDKKQSYPDYEIYSSLDISSSVNPLTYCNDISGYCKDIREAIYEKTKGRSVYHVLLLNLHPKSRGKISLRSKNYREAPLVKTGFFTDERDLINHVRYVRNFLNILNTTSFVKMGAEFVDPVAKCGKMRYNSDEYWRCYVICMINSGQNYCGTCSMGSVVDSRLRVYNMTNLRVADASVIPSPVRSHINAATIMIAEKASDMIKEDYQLK